jgi:hypothetical protein
MLKDECFKCRYYDTATCCDQCGAWPPEAVLKYYEVMLFPDVDEQGGIDNRWQVDEYSNQCDGEEITLEVVKYYPEGHGYYDEARYYVALRTENIASAVFKAEKMIQRFKSQQEDKG